jgi:hypothetical protein
MAARKKGGESASTSWAWREDVAVGAREKKWTGKNNSIRAKYTVGPKTCLLGAL